MNNFKTKNDFINEIVLHFNIGQAVNDVLKELEELRNYKIDGNRIFTYYEKRNGDFKNEIIIELDVENRIIKLYKHKQEKSKSLDDEFSSIYQEEGKNKIIKKHCNKTEMIDGELIEKEEDRIIYLEKEETKGKYEKEKIYEHINNKKYLKTTKETMNYILPTNDRLIIATINDHTSYKLTIKDDQGIIHTKELTPRQAEEILKRSDDPYNLINYKPYYYKQKDVNPYKM